VLVSSLAAAGPTVPGTPIDESRRLPPSLRTATASSRPNSSSARCRLLDHRAPADRVRRVDREVLKVFKLARAGLAPVSVTDRRNCRSSTRRSRGRAGGGGHGARRGQPVYFAAQSRCDHSAGCPAIGRAVGRQPVSCRCPDLSPGASCGRSARLPTSRAGPHSYQETRRPSSSLPPGRVAPMRWPATRRGGRKPTWRRDCGEPRTGTGGRGGCEHVARRQDATYHDDLWNVASWRPGTPHRGRHRHASLRRHRDRRRPGLLGQDHASWDLLLTAHALLVTLVLLAPSRASRVLGRFFGDWYPMLLLGALYAESRVNVDSGNISTTR